MRGAAVLFGARTEKLIIFLLCLFAALRVAFYSAAFPFFGNVDELMHFDLVIKYRDGFMPRKLNKLDKSTANYMAGCNSTEYATLEKEKKAVPYFLQDLSDSVNFQNYTGTALYWKNTYNYESGMAPMYYVLAGLWAKIGQVSGAF
jgi:hypothetical protein